VICQAANKTIKLNRDRLDKTTISATGAEGRVAWMESTSCATERDEVRVLAQEAINTGTAPHEIAVLCRTNRLAQQMRDHLTMAGLPVAGTDSPRKPKDWRLLTLLIQLIGSPDNWAIGRLLWREEAKLKKLDLKFVEANHESYRSRYNSPIEVWLPPSLAVVLTRNADFSRYGVSKASHALLNERIKYYAPATVEELLEAMRENPEAKTTHGINVMTVHAAKGDEWDMVIVPGAELFRAVEVDDTEEERRLFFVAATRARSRLEILWARNRVIDLPAGGSVLRKVQALPDFLSAALEVSTP
jgi:superfamily I DNA/RNA helicase